MFLRMLVTGFLALGLMGVVVPGAQATDPPSSDCRSGTLAGAEAKCSYTVETLNQEIRGSSGATWSITEVCKSEGESGVCDNPVPCPDNTGTLHSVYRDGEFVGSVCLDEDDEVDATVDIATVVLSRFKGASWPPSTVSVQPKDGRTLVNFDTIFFTNNRDPHLLTLRVLGRDVTIEAAPVQYLWRFGDGTTSTTTSPGFPYEEGQEVLVEGRVTHRYERVTDAVSVSVDTTYRGRYRVGDGPWQPIAETLTVAGDDVELEVLEARPQLVR